MKNNKNNKYLPQLKNFRMVLPSHVQLLKTQPQPAEAGWLVIAAKAA
jgi:hypothetical protein